MNWKPVETLICFVLCILYGVLSRRVKLVFSLFPVNVLGNAE